MEMKTTNYLQGIKPHQEDLKEYKWKWKRRIISKVLKLIILYVVWKIIIYILGTSFEIQADIFMSLESIWRAFGRVKYRKTSKSIYILFYDKSMVY